MRSIIDIAAEERETKLRFQSTVVPLFAHDDSVIFLRGAGPLQVKASPALRELVGLLGEPRPVSELVGRITDHHMVERKQVLGWLDQLGTRGLLFEEREAPADPSVDWSRYARQLDMFASRETAATSRFDYQRRLSTANVLQVGLGGLGTWISQNLAMAGIGQLTLVDGDIVELSNLHRQVLYTGDDLGRPKVDAAIDALRRLNPDAAVIGHQRFVDGEQTVRDLLDEATPDLVVVSADEPFMRLRTWVTKACFERGVPHLFVAAGTVGPLVDPGRRMPCWLCQEAAVREALPDYPHWLDLLDSRETSGRRPPQAVFPGYHSLFAGLIAMETIRFLAGFEEPRTIGHFLQWNAATSTIGREALAIRTDCAMGH